MKWIVSNNSSTPKVLPFKKKSLIFDQFWLSQCVDTCIRNFRSVSGVCLLLLPSSAQCNGNLWCNWLSLETLGNEAHVVYGIFRHSWRFINSHRKVLL